MDEDLGLLPSFKTCYFCGTSNLRGLRIRYRYDPERDRVVGGTEPDPSYCGFPGILHGGLQSALLDDVMYWAVAYRTATSSVTAELTCRYRKPAPLGQSFRLVGRCLAPHGRKVRTTGELLSATGEVLAEGSALYLLYPREEFVSNMLPWFDFEGCTPAMVRHFTGDSGPTP